MQVIPLLDDPDADIRASALRIVGAVLACACDVSVASGLAACPRLSDGDDKAVEGVVQAALARLRRSKDEPTEHSLRWDSARLVYLFPFPTSPSPSPSQRC